MAPLAKNGGPRKKSWIAIAIAAMFVMGLLSAVAFGDDTGGATPSSATTDTTAVSSSSADDTTPTDTETTSTAPAGTTAAPTDTTTSSTSTDTTTTDSTTTSSTFTPTISSDKLDYAPGATVTLSGTGWGATESVHIRVDDSDGQLWSYDTYVTADTSGSFTHQLQLPNSFIANYAVVATGASGTTAQTTFTDAGSLSVAPLQGSSGTSVAVTTGGQPFDANRNDIGIYWDGTVGQTTGTLVATCSTNGSNGNLQTCSFTVPPASVGDHTVVATQQNNHNKSESATFTVVGAATQITFGTQPSPNQNIARGNSISVTVQAKDANGNIDTGHSGTASLALGSNPGGATLSGTTSASFVNGVATFSVSLDRTGTGYTLVASSAGLANATSNAFNITGSPILDVGAVVPSRELSPTAGFIMRDTGRSLTVDVTVTDPGSNASGAGTMVVGTTSTGASVLTFQTAGSSGTCITNCTGAPTWTATNLTGGITFTHTSGVPPAGSVYRFTVSVASVPALAADATDSFTANYTRGSGGTGTSSATAADNTLKRYSLEITGITPPGATQGAGATINPLMTVVNRSSATINAPFLTAGSTTLGGTAFSSTPSSTISATNVTANSSGTATFTGAVVTSPGGSQSVVGNAAKGATITAPTFSKSITVTIATFALSVSKTGAGSGTVTSSPAGIDCGATCSASFANGSSVTLTATPAAGSTFDGWTGDGTGTATRALTIDAAKSVTALFKANQTVT